jgi:hypothetical protein
MKTERQLVRQSMAGIVRENLLHIESQIARGVKVPYIHAEFANMGMVGNLWSFRKAITRARKKARAITESDPVKINAPEIEANTTKVSGIQGNDGDLDHYFKRASIFFKKGN